MNDLLRRLARFDDDDEGAALTEFVICLPIFLVVFYGLLNFALLGQQSVAVKTAAAQDMWVKSYAAETETMRYSPRPQIADAFGQFADGAGGSVDVGAITGGVADLGDGIGGHWGESYLRSELVMPVVTLGGLRFANANTEPGNRLKDLASYNPQEDYLLGDTQHAPMFLDDALTQGDANLISDVSGAWGAVDAIAGAIIQVVGGMPGTFAGIRYGSVTGEQSASITIIGNQSHEFGAQYSTLVSPEPRDPNASVSREQATWGMGWVLAQPKCHYRNMLNMLAPSLTTDCDASYTVEKYATAGGSGQ